jgi:hypothetical protein
MNTAVSAIGAYSPLALAVSLIVLMATAVFKGWLIPAGVAKQLFDQWIRIDDLRETARAAEREQLSALIKELTEALR